MQPPFLPDNNDNIFELEPSLPLELEEKIFEHEPELIGKYRLLNKRLEEAARHMVMEKICSKPISQREILKYLESEPNKIAIFYIS